MFNNFFPLRLYKYLGATKENQFKISSYITWVEMLHEKSSHVRAAGGER